MAHSSTVTRVFRAMNLSNYDKEMSYDSVRRSGGAASNSSRPRSRSTSNSLYRMRLSARYM
jgi:hypothetical protein